MKRTVLLFTLLTLLVSPVFSIRKGEKLILDKLALIEKTLLKIDNNFSIISSEFSTMFSKLKMIESKINGIAQSNADNKQGDESISIGLHALKEEILELKKGLSELNQRVFPPSESTTNDPEDIEGNQETVAKTGEENKIDLERKESPDIYLLAYSDYINKNYSLAIQGFRKFIQLYPDTLRAKKALYWIGECYYVQKNYEQAIEIFNELLEKYTEGANVSDSLLKKGFALIKLGRHVDGKKVLRKLISRYPFSELSSLAKQKLKEIADQ